jgi:glc operon protein GlcG
MIVSDNHFLEPHAMTAVPHRLALAISFGLFLLAPARSAPAQERLGADAKGVSEIRDDAGMFGTEARKKAAAELEQLEKARRIPVLIETRESLDGQDLETAASRRARQWDKRGLYVLLVRKDHKIDVLRHPSLESVIPKSGREAIRDAFIAPLRTGNSDGALAAGIKAIGEVLGKSASEGNLALPAPLPVAAGAAGNLVARNQVRLNLGGARTIQSGAEAKAVAMGLKVNIAVVDDGGHLVSFTRMDGARPASAATAMTKATTAATFRQATGPLPAGAAAPDLLLNISLQNAAAASGGKLTTLYGGVPIVVDGQVIGAIGIGGGTGEQDAEIARAGVAALTDALKERSHGETNP